MCYILVLKGFVDVNSELGKILTNGTLVDPHFLQDEQAGHLVAIRVCSQPPTHVEFVSDRGI